MKDERYHFEMWLMGFLSGVGYARVQVGPGMVPTDHLGAVVWMTKHCAENPLKAFIERGDRARQGVAVAPRRISVNGSLVSSELVRWGDGRDVRALSDQHRAAFLERGWAAGAH